MQLNYDFLLKNYVIPFRINRDNRKDIFQKLYKEKNLNSIIKLLLTEQGWRNKQFAAICIGVFKLEEFIEQIFKQASSLDEFYTAEAYSFALITIKSTKAKKYLKELSKIDTSDSEYSKNVQKFYKAGLLIIENEACNNDDLLLFINSLEDRMENWYLKIY